jgi:hypothetical protein
MGATSDAVRAWADAAREKLGNGGLTGDDLDALVGAVQGTPTARQRLLYLHASTPNIQSQVVAFALHEPVDGAVEELTPEPPEIPYGSVKAAIIDGWQVIHFPDQLAPFDDREIDMLGYEFILQKIEEVDV